MYAASATVHIIINFTVVKSIYHEIMTKIP